MYSLTSRIGAGSSSNKLSRPARALRTMRAPSSTRRCLVTACRVMRVPSVSWAIDRGCPLLSLAMSESLVSSPSAAKIGAYLRRPAAALRALRDMTFDVLHLLCPAIIVHAQRFNPSVSGNLVESGLGNHEQRTAYGLLEAKLDERRRFLRIIHVWIYRVRMPGEGEESLGLHLLDCRLPFEVLIPRMSDLAARDPATYERPVELYAKPYAELAVIRDCAPHPRYRRLQLDTFFDAIGHREPPGCILISRKADSQPLSCMSN